MPDSLLTISQKKKIITSVQKADYRQIVLILESVKTSHAGTAKTKDKHFVITSIVKHITEKYNGEDKDTARAKAFFTSGNCFFKMKEPVSKQISASLLWRAYQFNKKVVKAVLLQIADDDNWEVRETSGGALANTLYYNRDFYSTLTKWAKHPSDKIRRAVVISSLGLLEKGKKENLPLAFSLLEPLLYDSAVYVKKNLGPFVFGSYFGNSFPEEVFIQLKKWLKIKDENVRWNIAMAFHNSFGNKYPDKAMEILTILAEDNNPAVKKAVKSSVNFLAKRSKKFDEFAQNLDFYL
jgi:hypothetical protein